ncbi:A disintegrin and metalloproteinase with thrombospondin motifs 7-like [Saccostrea cucullata]|uniref:A disintegrin and metalloproteinase with thrombospondin motifs 7-like n=1 Tax=Saccostrea cuccullata TaxID=36930 RepID=UPI002ED10CA6
MYSVHKTCTANMVFWKRLSTLTWTVMLYLVHGILGTSDYVILDQHQGSFINKLDNYDITIPVRVTSRGDVISHELHPHKLRHRRNSDQISDTIHYKLNVNNSDYILKLKPNVKLYNPSLVIERKKNIFKNVTDSSFMRYTNNNQLPCHYTGEIMDKENSKVALALCDGLHGLIHTGNATYFIEPMQQPKNNTGHLHAIYQHEPRTETDLGHSDQRDTCGNNEIKTEKANKQRERWEAHHQRKNGRNSRRHKRSISVEHHVETLVVVDPDMTEYYKNEDVTTYVLTIMNMVSQLFHDASLGNAVNIVVVRIILLEDQQEGLIITHHADKSLRSFCKWQTKINMKEEDHPNHHDVAILLTRKNICARMNRPCNTLGLAQTSGMCQPHRSCSINEDTGLSLAYTVAHELGHNFGMNHDSRRNGCKTSSKDHYLYLMQNQLMAVSPLMKWSNCSKRAITEFIDRGWGYCLEDEPAKYRDTEYEYPVLPPGTMYDVEHQCRLAYGQNSSFCGEKEDICSTLWCRMDNKCSTRLEAAAEGTICGPNKWCFNEQCVEIGDRPESINGNWGEWSSWSTCSRTCGAGVSARERHCDNPRPANGGKYCIGERKRYRICNTEACPENSLSFQEVQCDEFNYIPYQNGLYEWQHVPTPRTPCQLHCKPENKFFSVMMKDIVTDGTPCMAGTRNLCISGRCRHIGCDWGIDSTAKEDRCGVCHGDGSTCETIKDQYNETQGMGYVEATVIPKDARNIRVEEVAGVDNYLALQNDKGQYYLNGHWFIQWSGDYNIAGTVVQYNRQGNRDKFEAVGPITEPLHIMLLLQTRNPGVVFEYTVPKENATDTRPREFQWTYMDWTHCTSSCGSGTQRAIVVCSEKEDGQVDDVYCNKTHKPDDLQRVCNVHLCPARWWAGPWQHCSVTCGKNGVHKRTVICVRSLGNEEQIALEDKSCGGEEKPTEVEACHHKDLCPGTGEWEVGEWTPCDSNPCSSQTREVKCSLPSIGCDKTPIPAQKRQCSDVICEKWTFGNWSECSVTCGFGVRLRNVTCPETKTCDATQKPEESEVCDILDCPTAPSTKMVIDLIDIPEESADGGYERKEFIENDRIIQGISTTISSTTEESSKTSPTTKLDDERGVIKGPVLVTEVTEHIPRQFLDIKEGGSDVIVDNQDIQQPTPSVDNHKIQGDNLLSKKVPPPISDFTQHKQSFGQTKIDGRKILPPNVDMDKIANIPHLPDMKKLRPLLKLPSLPNISGHPRRRISPNTIIIPSVFEWVPKTWNPCSRKCGGGIQTRAIGCVDSKSGQETEEHNCNILTKMDTIRPCNTQQCSTWQTSIWSQCSATCGEAVQIRDVVCSENLDCDPDQKPVNIQPCVLPKCLAWKHGPWNTCSKTCGKGEQIRAVQCINMTSETIATDCDMSQKPAEVQSCNPDACPRRHSELKTSRCKRNRLNYRVCRKLRERGQCARVYVRVNCCRTCEMNRYRTRWRPRRRQAR